MKSKKATAQSTLDLSMAVIDLYFRIQAATDAIAGFAQAGGDFGFLRSLAEDGPQTVPEIARQRPVSRQYCLAVANNLAKQGLVEFIENPKHKRSQLVRITKKGRATFDDLTKRFLAAAAVVAVHFEERDVVTATSVLRKAREVLAV